MSKQADVVILLGAGRSGTTLLYKVLSTHRRIAYFSGLQRRFPGWPSSALLHRVLSQFPSGKRKIWFQQGGGAYLADEGRGLLMSIFPLPTEVEPVYERCGVPLFPSPGDEPAPASAHCLRRYFKKMISYGGGRVIVTKRTANNRRISWLSNAFPGAKYIHLVRDGRAVAYSLLRVGWWNDHVLFWSGKTPREMVNAGADPYELAARNWVEEMKLIEAGIATLDPQDVIEVRYDELLSNPRSEMLRILRHVELDPDSDPSFWGLLDSLGLKPRKEPWTQKCSDKDLQTMRTIQSDTLKNWGFSP